MARGSDPLRLPSPAKDGLGKEGAGLPGVLFPLPCALVIERHRLHLQLVQLVQHIRPNPASGSELPQCPWGKATRDGCH